MSDCLYFGCWNESGHFLVGPGKTSIWLSVKDKPEYYSQSGRQRHLDGTLAPRRLNDSEQIVWTGMSADDGSSFGLSIKYRSHECPQGQFMRHVLDNGYTAIQWWDRSQGDKRGGSNSTILLKGEHTAEEMLAALNKHFPHIIENLKRAGIELVEVIP